MSHPSISSDKKVMRIKYVREGSSSGIIEKLLTKYKPYKGVSISGLRKERTKEQIAV